MTGFEGSRGDALFAFSRIFALACVTVAVVGKTVVAGDAPLFTGLRNEQQLRTDSQKQFREIHSDRTGRYRPDLLTKASRRLSGYRSRQHGAAPPRSRGARSPTRPQLPRRARSQARSGCSTAPSRCGSMPSRTSRARGPDAGMITELAIDPRGTTDQVIYQSNNDGGIWKTTDGGATWTPMTDFMPSNSMGAVTLDAGNPSIVYAGTGNLVNNGFFNPTGGLPLGRRRPDVDERRQGRLRHRAGSTA